MALTQAQMEARLELIKAAAKKYEFKRKQKINSAKVRRWSEIEEKPARARREKKLDETIARLDENHNHWTDASSYANEYYGETMRATTQFDNDWD